MYSFGQNINVNFPLRFVGRFDSSIHYSVVRASRPVIEKLSGIDPKLKTALNKPTRRTCMTYGTVAVELLFTMDEARASTEKGR